MFCERNFYGYDVPVLPSVLPAAVYYIWIQQRRLCRTSVCAVVGEDVYRTCLSSIICLCDGKKTVCFYWLKCPCTPLKYSFNPLKCPSPEPVSIAMSISDSNNLSHSRHEVKLQMCLCNPGNVYTLFKVGNVLTF